MNEKVNLQKLIDDNFIERIFEQDGTIWKSDEKVVAHIENRLGWVESPIEFLNAIDEITSFSTEVTKSGIKNVVLCGMGGSSLSPEVAQQTYGSAEGYPELIVLDNTSPFAVKSVENQIDLMKTVFIVASKSGGTVETMSFYKYFFEKIKQAGVDNPGDHFIAITDPGSNFEREATDKNFRKTFTNPPNIGGRYSVLSYFGLVPMGMIGVDIQTMCEYAVGMISMCHPEAEIEHNAGLSLGNWIGTQAQNGKDKLTLIFDDAISSFAYWAEQLIAESVGKEGKGVVPIVNEARISPDGYGDDRAFVSMGLDGNDDTEKEAFLSGLEKAGQPLYRIILPDTLALGGEFWCWEFATAVAGKLLDVNPFDEPNVSEAKASTDKLLDFWRENGKLTNDQPVAREEGYEIYSNMDIHSMKDLTNLIQPKDYFSQLIYFPKSNERHQILEKIRLQVGQQHHVATTLDYGPRYLHSTGQLHKGGPNNGVYLMMTTDQSIDLPVPGTDYDFQTLHLAKGLGDYVSLTQKRRRVARIHITGDVDGVISKILNQI
jgi:glucose-6-phosphate isomerase